MLNKTMEELKTISQLTKIDERHIEYGQVFGCMIDLELLHNLVSDLTLHDGVPEEIRDQFTIIRNMALYTYYLYTLATVVTLKTYILIEHALKLRFVPKKPSFKHMLQHAVDNKWVINEGFRHIKNSDNNNDFCKELVELLPKFRNDAAHGSSSLDIGCVKDIEICADFINQLYDQPKQA